MFDWLVQQIGPSQFHLFHRKSTDSHSTPSHGAMPSHADVTPTSSTSTVPETSFCTSFKHKRQRTNIEPVAFDLTTSESPLLNPLLAHKPQTMPNAQTSPIVPLVNNSRTTTVPHKLSPRTSTKNLAHTIIYDYLASYSDTTHRPDTVLYGQPIHPGFQRMPVPPSPSEVPLWSSVQYHPVPDGKAIDTLIEWNSNATECNLDSLLVLHPFPRQLSLSVREIKSNFLPSHCAEHEFVDAVFRRFNHLDNSCFQPNYSPRWRYFLETDFSMHTLANANPESCQSILNQFSHGHHCILHCQMIICPLIVDEIWCAYMFDMHNTKVHVLDPCHSTERSNLHEYFTKLTISSINCCLEAFFQGCSTNPTDDWEVNYPNLISVPITREESGICMILLARHFNGQFSDIIIDKDVIEIARPIIIYEALSLPNNSATLPRQLAAILK